MGILDAIRNNFYLFDFIIAAAVLLTVVFLRVSGRLSRFHWILFWVGAILGLTWELGCNINMLLSEAYPVARFITPPPVHFGFVVAAHSLWDGGLFLAGVWLVQKLCSPPWFEHFRMRELLVLIVWGQTQELAVELLSTYSSAWEWIVYWWNPSLFVFNGHPITLFPQLIWLAAVLVFYPIAVMVKRKLNYSDGSFLNVK
jgi:hypothetical protein